MTAAPTHVATVLSLPSLTLAEVHHLHLDPDDAMAASTLAAYCGPGSTRCRDLVNDLVVRIVPMDEHLRERREANAVAELLGIVRDEVATFRHRDMDAFLDALGYDWKADRHAARDVTPAPARARHHLRLVRPEL